nr:putative transmembrane protein (PGPGW) [uncultured bacterium]
MILPIIPGIPILVAGVAILGTDHPIVRPFARRFEQLRQRYTKSQSKDEGEESNKS